MCLLAGWLVGLQACSDDNGGRYDEWPDGEGATAGSSGYWVEDTEMVIPDDEGDPGDDELVPNSQDVEYDNAVYVRFTGDRVEVLNTMEGEGVTVTVDGCHVRLESSLESTEIAYVLSGVTDDGSVWIKNSYRFSLVLNGVGITNPRGAAINIQSGKRVGVVLQDGTVNRLIDGETYDYIGDENMKGTFFSEGQLIFDGEGTLEVRGKNKHAICSDDYLRFNSGTIWVKEAASDAIHANDYITVNGGTVTTRSEGEGLECEKGYVEIYGRDLKIVTVGGKGHGIKSSDNTLIETDGTVDITVYGDASKCINSKGDLTVWKGTLKLSAAGSAIWDEDDNDTSSCAGVKCSSDMYIGGGEITVLSTGEGGKGINVDGELVIDGGNITVTTTGDQFVYKNYDTAAKAIKSTGDLTVNGGTFKVRAYKTEAEGIESKATLKITGGDLDIRVYDDCLNASDHIQIDGGTIFCYSLTNDGIDSNGTLTITGGTIVAVGAASPEDGIDCDNNRFTITGGTVVGLGGGTSTPTESACTQRSVIFRASSGYETACIQGSTGEVLVFELPRTYSGTTTLLFSSPDIREGESYTIYTEGTVSGGTGWFGLYTGADYTGGTSAGSFTAGSMVSTVGSSSGGPGGGRW